MDNVLINVLWSDVLMDTHVFLENVFLQLYSAKMILNVNKVITVIQGETVETNVKFLIVHLVTLVYSANVFLQLYNAFLVMTVKQDTIVMEREIA